MGIPHYYKHIINNYKSILKSKVQTCNRLYIDFNSIIHQCAGQVVSVTPKYTFQNIIDTIIAHTTELIDTMKPSDLVFIGIDGVAPRAKMVQQRKRRYLTAYKNNIIKDACEKMLLPPPPDWDSNIITPGTSFMTMLDEQLTRYFDNRQQKLKLPYKVIISGSGEPGEGEQKLFDHMHQNGGDKKDPVNIINGLDADLIMLSLLSKNKIFLQRDSNTFVDVGEFRRCISLHVDPDHPCERVMYDYVFLCFLLGNDFVPNVPFLKIRMGAADILLDIYRKVRSELMSKNGGGIDDINLVVVRNGEFKPNFQVLKMIMKHLADMEAENMEFAVKQYNGTEIMRNYLPNIPQDCPRNLRKFLIELEQYPLQHRHPLSGDFTRKDISWATLYYQELLGCTDAKPVCEKYLDGLIWVMNYYFNRKYDSFWYYKYQQAPLCVDIYKTILSALSTNTSFYEQRRHALMENSLPLQITPKLQLLLVIPVQSSNILPEPSRRIMTDIEYGCVHYYPEEYELCTFMKRFLWECTPILPDIDIVHLEKVLRVMQNQHEPSH